MNAVSFVPMEEIALVVDDDESSIELENDSDEEFDEDDDEEDDADDRPMASRGGRSLSRSDHAALNRSSGSLLRSDGREACLGKSCPRLGGLKELQQQQHRQTTAEVLSLPAMSRRAPGRELRRRRPVDDARSTRSPSTPSTPISQAMVSEDSSTNLMTDQAPACPRRERSMDQDEWGSLDLNNHNKMGSLSPTGSAAGRRLPSQLTGRRE